MTPLLRLVFPLLLLANEGQCWRCDVDAKICEIWLEVDHKLTMMQGYTLVKASDGSLYPYDLMPANYTAQIAIPKENVITGDGWADPRVVIAVNGTVPGPLLEVHEGQKVRVHVHNKMFSESTSIHFHGQHQKGTPWMDGVSFVTQCPILSGQKFVHEFTAYPEGTHWYHGHTGSHLSMGLLGGLVVHPRAGSNPRYHREFTMLVMDYNHDWDATMDFMKMQYGMYVNGKIEDGKKNVAGGKYSKFRCQSLLINGRGRYRDPANPGSVIKAPLETYSVVKGSIYRFRVVHTGSVFPFRVSVDGHKLRVVATDGIDLQPVEADSVILTPGERYDFEINATQTAGNYWIRTETLEYGSEHTGEAILHYEGAAEMEPTTQERQCTVADPCTVVNCPFLNYPSQHNRKCINVEQLRSAQGMPAELANASSVNEYFLNFAFPGQNNWYPASINGISFEAPHVAALTQPKEVDNRCPGDKYRCEEEKQCKCASVLDLEHGKVIQFVASNQGNGTGWDHPMHLHGHSFWVVKIGYPNYDQQGQISGDNLDIDCGGQPNRNMSYCNQAKWSLNMTSSNQTETMARTGPQLQFDQAVLKDTINVPTGGYVVVRFLADNPGLWALHCHISLHSEDGMFMVVNESFPNQPSPPSGFQRCNSFPSAYYSGGEVKEPSSRASSTMSASVFLLLFFTAVQLHLFV